MFDRTRSFHKSPHRFSLAEGFSIRVQAELLRLNIFLLFFLERIEKHLESGYNVVTMSFSLRYVYSQSSTFIDMKNYLVPQNLDLEKFTYPEHTARFVDLLIRYRFASHKHSRDKSCSATPKFYGDRVVRVSAKTIRKLVGRKRHKKIIDELISEGVIERRKQYKIGVKSFGYRFTTKYRDEHCIPHQPSMSEMPPEKIIGDLSDRSKRQKEKFENRIKEVKVGVEGYKISFSHIGNISLECTKEAFEIVTKTAVEQWMREYRSKKSSAKPHDDFGHVHKSNYLLWKYTEIEEAAGTKFVPFYQLDDFGRFHYYLTNLPRELRPYGRINGNRVIAYDITSSQVIFFAVILRERCSNCFSRRENIDFPKIIEEIRELYPRFMPMGIFKKEAQNKSNRRSYTLQQYRLKRFRDEIELLFRMLQGDFYAEMMKECGWSHSRDDFKKKFFEILYGPNGNYRCEVFKGFCRLFPYTALVLWDTKDLGNMHRRKKEIANALFSKTTKLTVEERTKVCKELKSEAQTDGLFYVNLPRMMQRKEAEFMFEKLIPMIDPSRRRIILPLHDCVLVEDTGRKNVKEVGLLIQKIFKSQEGINVDVKCEKW